MEIEENIRKFLKQLLQAGKINKKQFNDLYPIGSQPGILYGLAKVHKPLVNGRPKFRPILSSIGTLSYKIAKFFVPLLSNLTKNEYTIDDSFEFGKEVLQQDPSLFMGSLDVEALFTSLPLIETINLTVDKLFENKDTVSNLNKIEFKKLLELACHEPWFIFNETYFQQIDGVAMGSPLGPTLANIFMCFHEKEWLENCPKDFKPVFYKRYVDDIFLLFRAPEHLKLFKDYMNTCHSHITFTSEEENENKMPFLDFLFIREEGRFTSSVYRKPTFTGVYSHFQSLLPLKYKIGLIHTLLHRIYNICSCFEYIVKETNNLKNIMKKNGYPGNIIDKCVLKFFDKIYTKKKIIQTVEKKKLLIVLPFLGSFSLRTKRDLLKLFKESLPSCSLQIVFKTQTRIRNFFPFKDKIPNSLLSHNVYFFKCTGCNSCYYGLSERHSKIRWYDHIGLSWRTGSKIVGVRTEIKDHSRTCKTTAQIENFKIIESEHNPIKLKILESLYIKRDRSNLNKNVYSTPLFLF